MSGLTSQPNLNSIVEALRHTPRDTGLDGDALNAYSAYWEAVRKLYYPFESGMMASTAEVYRHEMPGGQVTNLQEQAKSMGLGPRWPEVALAYEQVNQLFGDIVKVTPTSKVVGDLALFMVANNLKPETCSTRRATSRSRPRWSSCSRASWASPRAAGRRSCSHRAARQARPRPSGPGELLPPTDFEALRKELAAKLHHEPSETDLLCYLMYPQIFLDLASSTAETVRRHLRAAHRGVLPRHEARPARSMSSSSPASP
jgi:pyruvate carboxylase